MTIRPQLLNAAYLELQGVVKCSKQNNITLTQPWSNKLITVVSILPKQANIAKMADSLQMQVDDSKIQTICGGGDKPPDDKKAASIGKLGSGAKGCQWHSHISGHFISRHLPVQLRLSSRRQVPSDTWTLPAPLQRTSTQR